jgi:alpha-N-acetylglucosaminidase
VNKYYISIFFTLWFNKTLLGQDSTHMIQESRAVIERTFGQKVTAKIHISYIGKPENQNPMYQYEVKNGELYLGGNTTISITRGFYDYIKETNQGQVTWSGKNTYIHYPWLPIAKKTVVSPYRFHYYLNVVTHGYTTPYWGFPRWEKELDWMALHGMDMPLINGAYEAILTRVFKKIGLKDNNIKDFFTGPAYHPWNRMGNITNWDSQVPTSYYAKQLKLTHQVLQRMKDLGMQPIIPAFAGFVPKELTAIYPQAQVKEIIWGGFSELKNSRGHILLPDNELFSKIGKMYVEEWEKEFGKAKYYLADSFNEMDVPHAATEEKQLQQLSDYGNVVYQSIRAANPDAVWVMQGWTFPYFRGSDGKIFWTEKRLGKLVEKVPDDKVMFLDLANEYNKDLWKVDPSWKTYHGFFNKMWVYSFIPNMGGKTPWNGILKTYAESAADALSYKNKGNLVGFGFAPEGIENNEIIYELLSDVGYSDHKIDLNAWVSSYCQQRYGGYPEAMQHAYDNFLKSCYGSFTDHPRFKYQQSAKGQQAGTVNKNKEFFIGVKQFLSCKDQLEGSELYKNDAIELSAQFLSLKADSIIDGAITREKTANLKELEKAFQLMNCADRLLLSHPNHKLSTWINQATKWGDTPQEKQFYSEDAKRLITTWGGTVNDYSARMWAGLISTYYVKRMKLYYESQHDNKPFDVAKWEESWIKKDLILNKKPFADPLKAARLAINAF